MVPKPRLRGPSIEETHPELVKEWDDDRYLPSELSFGSSIKIQWKCGQCGHRWKRTPNSRTNPGTGGGCPVCVSGHLHSDGRNSLQSTNPEIAEDFDLQNNDGLTPHDVVAGTSVKIHWKCSSCNYQWIASGAHRITKGRNCRACANQAVKPDLSNSLGTIFPDLRMQFDKKKNPTKSVDDYTSGSTSMIWWLCDVCEHSWKTSIVNRTNNGSGCPCCAGNSVHSDGRNSMEITHPELSIEFHECKNDPLTPRSIKAGTGRKLWWKCAKCSHEWKTAGSNRVAGNGCPACAGKAVHVDGRNSLDRLAPELSVEWHPTRNDSLSPSQVVFGSGKVVWWKCNDCENEWKSRINHRTLDNVGCPTCAGKSVHSDGRNSMEKTHPELAKEWHPSKNPMSPSEVIAGTGKRIWWLCSQCDGEWKTTGSARVGGSERKGTACPFCTNTKVHPDGRNSMASQFPELLPEWNVDKNQPKTPHTVLGTSNRKVWWICTKCDGEWKTAVSNRTRLGSGCPSCANYGFDPILPAYFYSMRISGPDGHWWYKGGIAADVARRRDTIRRSLHSNGLFLEVEILSTTRFSHGRDAKSLESQLLAVEEIRLTTPEKFDGSSELFSTDPLEYAKENFPKLIKTEYRQTTISDW